MEVVCRAADFLDKMKQTSSKHYDEDNGFGTAGSIFRALAAEADVPAVVSGVIDSLKIPYRLRWNQSPLDFASDLADDIGAILKPQAGRLVVLPRGGGQSASGQALPEIRIEHDKTYAWDIGFEERNASEKVGAVWFNSKTGRLEGKTASTGRAGGNRAGQHPYASDGEAQQGGSSQAQQLSRYTGTGSFEVQGQPQAVAGASVRCTGFGSKIDGTEWEAVSVTHEILPEDGWITIVEVETQEAAA